MMKRVARPQTSHWKYPRFIVIVPLLDFAMRVRIELRPERPGQNDRDRCNESYQPTAGGDALVFDRDVDALYFFTKTSMCWLFGTSSAFETR